jgi:hypothetical protein
MEAFEVLVAAYWGEAFLPSASAGIDGAEKEVFGTCKAMGGGGASHNIVTFTTATCHARNNCSCARTYTSRETLN